MSKTIRYLLMPWSVIVQNYASKYPVVKLKLGKCVSELLSMFVLGITPTVYQWLNQIGLEKTMR